MTSGGQLVLMFTAHDPESGQDALMVSRSDDDGRAWSEAKVVYGSSQGRPQAIDTLTRVRPGRLLAPLLDGSNLRMLASDDDGRTWQVSNIDVKGLEDATPYGPLVELQGQLLMPVFGILGGGDQQAPCSGIYRSRDGGKTWGDFTVIDCDRKEGSINFGPTAVHAGTDGQLLALITADEFIYRSLSTDGGKTWSRPDQRLLARHAALASVGSVLACVNQTKAGGMIRIQFSENMFDSWRCDRMLDQGLKGEYCSAVALDDDRVLLVHDRGSFPPGQRGTRAATGIEIAMMQRNPACPQVPRIIPPEKRDRLVRCRAMILLYWDGPFRRVAAGE